MLWFDALNFNIFSTDRWGSMVCKVKKKGFLEWYRNLLPGREIDPFMREFGLGSCNLKDVFSEDGFN